MLRYKIALVAVILGVAVAAADIAIGQRTLPGRPPGNPRQRTPEEDRLIFDACVAFYGIAFSSGKVLYRWMGARSEEAELRQSLSWYIIFLNIVGGIWLIFSGWQGLQLALLRPSMVVGLLLFVLTAFEGYEKLRSASGAPPWAE